VRANFKRYTTLEYPLWPPAPCKILTRSFPKLFLSETGLAAASGRIGISSHSSISLNSDRCGLCDACGWYQVGRPRLELTLLDRPLIRFAKSEIFRVKMVSLKAFGTDGMHRMRNPDVTSPMLQRPIGPMLKVMSSAPSARVVDTSRMAPQMQPLSRSEHHRRRLE